MRFSWVIITLFTSLGLSAQCIDCTPLNANGNFEAQNNIPGSENAIGISKGEIKNWYATHGTADYFSDDWNWYYLENIDSNMGHICYGSRPSHMHSEGIFTEVKILNDADLSYCLNFDYASYSDTDKPGNIHIYLNNNLEAGSHNGFVVPSENTHSTWFESAQNLDKLVLDAETDIRTIGMTNYSLNFTPDASYDQLWLYTEYLQSAGEYANCGFMIDNVSVTCKTDALIGIEAVDLGNNNFEFIPVLSKPLDIVEYEWSFDNGQKSNFENAVTNLKDGLHDICLKIRDSRGACAEFCLSLRVGKLVSSTCDYSVCLSSGGAPSIASLVVETTGGQVIELNESTEGFSFPYCISTPRVCPGGEYELSYLVSDLQSWMDRNGYLGQVEAVNDPSMDDNCRGKTLAIQQSSLTFLKFVIENGTDSTLDIQKMFDYDNCTQDTTNSPEETMVEVTVFPNPTVDFIKLDFGPTPIEQATVQLTEANGNLIDTVDLSEVSSWTFDVTNQKPGAYHLRVITPDMSESCTFIKI